MGMLSPYRVLDLTDERAALGPMMLANLGAEVIRIEPPGFEPEPGNALRYAVYNRGKQRVGLDLDTEEGRNRFFDLVRGADFVFENAGPGAMAARGLGHEVLLGINPRLVYVALSPFGQDGPYADFRAPDLVLAAMGGMMALNGDPDRPPVRVTVPQCWLHGAAESAVGAMVAHHLRERTGVGRFVDVSVQAAVFWTGLQAMIAHAIQGRDFERAGTALQLGTITLPMVYRAKDGEVVVLGNGATLKPMMAWLVRDGIVPEEWLEGEEWARYDVKVLAGEPLKYGYEEVLEKLQQWIETRTKKELLEIGLASGVTFAPVTTVPEILDFVHLQVREYWRDLEVRPGVVVKAPGPWVRAMCGPLEFGSKVEPQGEPPPREPRQVPGGEPEGTLPFAGLKVADFSWIGVGPITGKYLADHGADVIRIETSNPPDRLRVGGPFKDGVFGPNRSQFFGAFNTSKRSIALNLKTEEGREIARKLIAWADVVLESFTPGTMADLGLDYEAAKALNPDVIYVSTCLMGQTGPGAKLAGYGNHAAAISGFYEVTGWDDRPPSGPFTAYTDTIAPRFLATSVMAAIDRWKRTGEGCRIEQAQMEAALHFLATELVEYQVNGRVPRRAGNEDREMAPHGAYPVAGHDEWIAIAVEDDAMWERLAGVIGEAWAAAPALKTADGRRARKEEVDAKLAAWTAGQDGLDLMRRLQAAGVAAGFVQRSSDLLCDPQLAHREFFHPLVHPEMGEVPYEGHQFIVSGYRSGPRRPAPCLGEHSMEVLLEVLGLEADEVARLAAGIG
ncbi:CoA transferase [Tepidiforma sp.]|uniref:CaiB/BaiF CoA transferase family protein n=1 Tax=Tepidiforma sp. TaxID=2682230 RepID=UPI00263070AE|nr:CoA transferase [Tepidiforma sp.]MCX7618676.1 CoA transferase [Tepidiforma sp.]